VDALATIITSAAPHHVHLLERSVGSAKRQTVPTEVLTFIDHERRGPAYGRNRLAAQVKTPFIVTLDADDYIDPHFVERTLAVWEAGSYVYTDWLQPLPDGSVKYVKAINCPVGRPEKGEANFHLATILIPTVFWSMLGGQDETLFGGEDTDFFWRMNAQGIRSIVLREPLYTYTADGHRATESRNDPRWRDLLRTIGDRYRNDIMGCCGESKMKELYKQTEADVLVRPLNRAATTFVGPVSGRKYGRISRSKVLYIDPADLKAKANHFQRVKDWEGVSPKVSGVTTLEPDPVARHSTRPVDTSERAEAARLASAYLRGEPVERNVRGEGQAIRQVGSVPAPDLSAVEPEWDNPAALENLIRRAGTRIYTNGGYVANGFDMQQTAGELAEFLYFLGDHLPEGRPVRVLEIGTGQSAGLARFMTEVLGWDVTSVDPREPEYKPSGNWRLVQSKSNDVKLEDISYDGETFDLVFIDGDHTFEAAQADWEKFSGLAPIVAIHDIDEAGWFGKDDQVAGFWRSIARGPKGGMKKGYTEFRTGGGQGIGVFIHE
jgi:hypothetical protein